MKRKLVGRSGFTLIELLVVIAIIAILAAILFPVFARARENARKSTCQSNLKQLGNGLMMYLQDYDERFPAGDVAGIAATGGVFFGLDPYLKNTQVWVCPSDSLQNVLSLEAPTRWPAFNRPASYGYNYWWQYQSQAVAQAVSETAMIVEMIERPYFYADGHNGFLDPPTNTVYPICDAAHSYRVSNAARHSEGLNMMFADGHVKWVKRENVERTRGRP